MIVVQAIHTHLKGSSCTTSSWSTTLTKRIVHHDMDDNVGLCIEAVNVCEWISCSLKGNAMSQGEM